jgi:transcriptional regulator with XRE-family HTH domain
VCSGTRVEDRLDVHTNTPAFPFCGLKLIAPKPLDPAYPREIKDLGDHVRRHRLEAGLIQREAARLIGISKKTIEGWETKRMNPGLRALPGIVVFLRYDPTAVEGRPLGPRLRAARRSRGLSIRELAEKLRVDPTTIWKWEHGRSTPFARYLPAILELVGDEQVSADAPLGDRIRAYRRRNGLTQGQFAERLGLQPGSVSDWELGKHPPCRRLLSMLEKLLGAD